MLRPTEWPPRCSPKVVRGFLRGTASSVTGRQLGVNLDDRASLFHQVAACDSQEIGTGGSSVGFEPREGAHRIAEHRLIKADLLGFSARGLETLHEPELDLGLDLFELGNRDRLTEHAQELAIE